MATRTKAEKIEFLEIGVSELKVMHNAISTSYDAMKTKALALVAGEIAIVTFLFADSAGVSTKITQTTYTISTASFYLLSIISLTIAFILFLYVVSPVQWHQPPDSKVVKNMDTWFQGDKEKFLTYLKGEYQEAVTSCNNALSVKARRFVLAIYLLVFGILILVLLKYGRGTITI